MATYSDIYRSALLRGIGYTIPPTLVALTTMMDDFPTLLVFAIPLTLAISLWRAFAFSRSADPNWAAGTVFIVGMSLLLVPFALTLIVQIAGSEAFGYGIAGLADAAIIVWFFRRATASAAASRSVALAIAVSVTSALLLQLLLTRGARSFSFDYFKAAAAFSAAGISTAAWLWAFQARDRYETTKGSTRCRECDYDLTGNTSGLCPECGVPVHQPGSLHIPAS